MNISIIELEARNFMSIGSISMRFDGKPGVILVNGLNKDEDIDGNGTARNGAGKSSIFQAIVYCLYGKNPRMKNARLVKMINDHTENSGMYTRVDLSSDGVIYRIESGIDISGKSANSYCRLFRDDNGEFKDITLSGIDKTREFIVSNIMHMSINDFMHFILMNTQDENNFFKMSDRDQNSFTNSLFNIDAINSYVDRINKEMKSIKGRKDVLTGEINVLVERREDLKSKADMFDENKKTELENLRNRYLVESRNLKKLESSNVTRNTELLSELDRKIEDKRKEIESISSRIVNNETEIRSIKKSQIPVIDEQISSDRKIKTNFNRIYSKCGDCPMISGKTESIRKITANIDSLTEKKKKLEDYQKQLETENRSNESALAEMKKSLDALKTERTEADREWNENNTKLMLARESVRNITEEGKRIKGSVNTFRDDYSRTVASLESKTKEIKDISMEYDMDKIVTKLLGNDAMKKRIINRNIAELRATMNNMLHRVGEKVDRIDIDDSLNMTFYKDNKDRDYVNYSGGESKKLDLVIGFAFREFFMHTHNINFNILVIDEYLDSGIDAYGILNMVRYLREISEKYGIRVYIITHREEVRSEDMDETLDVVREDFITRIEE